MKNYEVIKSHVEISDLAPVGNETHDHIGARKGRLKIRKIVLWKSDRQDRPRSRDHIFSYFISLEILLALRANAHL